MAKILLIDDDKALCQVIEDWLEHRHHSVQLVHDGIDGISFLQYSHYDLVILDINMPGKDGFDLCREYRAGGGQTPILMLTGKDKIRDKEMGFGLGADDYLTKPFHMEELMMRVQALLRRANTLISNTLKAGNITLDPNTFSVWRADEKINLSKIEFALLEFFMRHPKQVFSPELIISRVWPSDAETAPETVRTCLKRLRSKIDEDGKPSLIQNIHGVGYVLEPKEERV